MPRPFGKTFAAALDGIVPQPPQRQGSREVEARFAIAARVVQTLLAAIRRQPAYGGHIDPRDGQANHADVDPVSQRPFWNQPGQQQRGL
jgi:hypothetical protein